MRCLVVDADAVPERLPAADLVIDAAYGTGFRGQWQAPQPSNPDALVLAVDIPSGIDGLTGEACGEVLAADCTVTFAAYKPGLLFGAGPDRAGEVVVADIGLDVSAARARLVDDVAVAAWLRPRARDDHKWRSAVRLVAGSPGMTGAAHLTAAAAQRAGAGYVRSSTPGSHTDPMAPTEVVVTALESSGWAEEVLADIDRFGALAVGPGLGRGAEVTEAVRRLVAAPTPMVVDGDGLVALGRDVGEVLSARSAASPPVVLTPHDGEFEALTGHRPEADRIADARALAAASGAVVLLKGPATVVAAPDGATLVVHSGDARLATAGTGDVLTGVTAAFLARGLAPLEAAAAAAQVHARAGALAWPDGMVASDLIPRLPEITNRLSGG